VLRGRYGGIGLDFCHAFVSKNKAKNIIIVIVGVRSSFISIFSEKFSESAFKKNHILKWFLVYCFSADQDMTRR
jgi:hypothetical protein